MDLFAAIYPLGCVEYQHFIGMSSVRLLIAALTVCQFSEGVIGPALFGLDWKTSCLCIVFFTAASALPVAYCATNGPKTGMRQMVQARYGMGWVIFAFDKGYWLNRILQLWLGSRLWYTQLRHYDRFHGSYRYSCWAVSRLGF